MADRPASDRSTLTVNTSLSVGLVVVLAGGLLANVQAYGSLAERLTGIEVGFGGQLKGLAQDVSEVRESVRDLSASIRGDVRALQSELNALRDRVVRIESAANGATSSSAK